MNLVARRRLIAGAAISVGALVGGLIIAPNVTAATNGLTITPAAVSNANAAADLTFKTTEADMTFGAEATFSRLNGPATFTVTIEPDPTSTTPPPRKTATQEVDFTDMGSGVGTDGPANAGTYAVSVTGDDPNGPLPLGGGTDTCASCFTVLPAGQVVVTSVTPSSLRPGVNGNVSILGNNFESGSRIDVLQAGTTTVDPAVSANNAPVTNGAAVTQGITTRTELKREFRVTAGATPGVRDVRVTNLDGNTALCRGCFFVAGPALTSVSPSGGFNTPGQAPTAITFNGSNVSGDGTPYLEFQGTPGGTTRSALTITGTNVRNRTATSVTADFDLQNVAPGDYQPVVRSASTGVVNACDTCRFTVVQENNRTPTLTSMDSDTATAGIQKDIRQGQTVTFFVNGTNFSKGAGLTLTKTGLTVTSVEFVSPELLRATIQAAADAETGPRDATVTLTDGKKSNTCTGCVNVVGSSSPTPSGSQSPSPQGCPGAPLTTTVNTKTINATGLASVTVRGATPSATIELQGYSQNHYGTNNFDNDDTPVDRVGTADSNGAITFNNLRPASNTRVHARQKGCTYGNSAVIEVRAMETLEVQRTGVRSYTFKGRSIPARPGGLIVSLYRITGQSCQPGVEPSKCPGEKFIGQARAVSLGSPGEGLYSIRITFPRTDQNVRDEFVVKTGRDAQNAPGRSNVRSLLIY